MWFMLQISIIIVYERERSQECGQIEELDWGWHLPMTGSTCNDNESPTTSITEEVEEVLHWRRASPSVIVGLVGTFVLIRN